MLGGGRAKSSGLVVGQEPANFGGELGQVGRQVSHVPHSNDPPIESSPVLWSTIRVGTIRAAGVAGFAPLVVELGGDPADLLRRVGLTPDALDDADTPIDDGLLTDLLDLAAAELNEPNFGLLMANKHQLEMLGPISIMMVNSGTVAEAFALINRYLAFHSPDVRATLEADPHGRPDVAALNYQAAKGGPPLVHLTDAGMGFVHNSFTTVFGPDYGLIEVDLPFRPGGGVQAHEEFYGVPVHEGRPAARLYFPIALLHAQISGADRSIRDAARARLDELLAADTEDMTGRVRGLVQATLGVTPVDIEDIAEFLAMHPRTLQRRLEDEGTVFSKLLDDARRRRAHWELTQTDNPVSQIAENVGFGHQSTLSRAATRWWGATPLQVRRRQRELVAKP